MATTADGRDAVEYECPVCKRMHACHYRAEVTSTRDEVAIAAGNATRHGERERALESELVATMRSWHVEIDAAREARADVERLLAVLKDARANLGGCDPRGSHPPRFTVDCDDEDGGLGRARRSEWCGGPCVIRERIDAALAGLPRE